MQCTLLPAQRGLVKAKLALSDALDRVQHSPALLPRRGAVRVESHFKTLLMKACTGAGIGCAPYSRGLIKPVTDFSKICLNRCLNQMRIHRRQLLCRCHTRFRLRRSRAKPDQSYCSFRAISSIFADGFAEQADVKTWRPGTHAKLAYLTYALKTHSQQSTPSRLRARRRVRSLKARDCPSLSIVESGERDRTRDGAVTKSLCARGFLHVLMRNFCVRKNATPT